jgi:hypothetical protein
MNVILFLGSGISLPSELPSTEQITDSILSGQWYEASNNVTSYRNGPPARYHRVEDNPSMGTEVEDWHSSGHTHIQMRKVRRLQQFLRLLRTHSDRYFIVTRRSRQSNYEDLYYLGDQLENEETAEVDNPAMMPFWRIIKEESESAGLCLPDNHPFPNEPTSLWGLVHESCKFIADIVRQSLWASKSLEPRGLEAVSELAGAPELESLDVFTLNHDSLIERLFSPGNSQFSDGFGSPSPAGIRFFDPEAYNTGAKIRLFKLHGSIDWVLWGGQVGLWPPGPAIDSGPGPTLGETRNLLVGTYNRIADYTAEVFSELHWRFHQALREFDTMIVSGYGWNDHAINGRLAGWLNTSGNKRFILFDRSPEEVLTRPRVTGWSYKSLVKEDKLILVPKYLSDPGAVEEMKARLGLK